jgi:DNA-directed RNA polymerase subunit M
MEKLNEPTINFKVKQMIGIEFCKKCRGIMVPMKKGKHVWLKCRNCGYEMKKEVKELKVVEKARKGRGVVLIEKEEIPLPVTDKFCPKCEHPKAYYWLQQTRSADEPPTQFFRCVKCQYVWREYK